MSWQASQEAAAIAKELTYNPEEKSWVTEFPKLANPAEVMSNDYDQYQKYQNASKINHIINYQEKN